MLEVIMYWKPGCPYCASAEALLQQKGITPIKFRIDNDSNPQIFINGRHIGGCDDLYALEEQNALDSLLKGL